MSKNLSAKYYQEIKERLQKELVKDIKIFLRRKRKNQKMKKNKLVEYRKKIL